VLAVVAGTAVRPPPFAVTVEGPDLPVMDDLDDTERLVVGHRPPADPMPEGCVAARLHIAAVSRIVIRVGDVCPVPEAT
jgi:hypothetical protein